MSTTATPEPTTTSTGRPASSAPPRERNGGVVAAFIAAGIGCAVFGAMVVGAAASEDLARLLTVSDPVGPLSGKALAAVAAWLGSWAALHLLLRRRDVSVSVGIRLTLALIGIALVETFPPVYERFMH